MKIIIIIYKSVNIAKTKKLKDYIQLYRHCVHPAPPHGQVHEERWRTCVSDVDNAVGFALGVMFVNETFDGQAKPEAEKMIKLVTKAFRQGLAEAHWMDKITRKNAEEKADRITNMIGYPDYIMNNTALEEKYADLTVDEESYFRNSVNFNQWVLRENLRWGGESRS